MAPEWEDPAGVPIDAILFGGRRSTVVPLVREAFDWNHGVFLGSVMASETTAAAAGAVGKLRFDPFAMLPFCGYHMGDYFRHWVEIGERGGDKLPQLFVVNWFRKDASGKFLWPGFGENSRVLAWIFRRCEGKAEAVETPAGFVPAPGAIDTTGLDISDEQMEELLAVDVDELATSVPQIHEHLAQFGDRLPQQLRKELSKLEERLGRA
jgi:phosphoenolpyruvate carboxykinase (GTP)